VGTPQRGPKAEAPEIAGRPLRALLFGALAALTLLAGCASAPLGDPSPSGVPPAEVSAWLECARELGFFVASAEVARGDGPARVLVTLFPPTVGALAHGQGVGRVMDDDVAALRWLTPAPAGRWVLDVVHADGGLVLERFAPGHFLDAQRLRVLASRCGGPRPGAGFVAALDPASAPSEAALGAARLAVDACAAADACPEGWRERLLALAAWRGAAEPAFEDDACRVAGPPRADGPHSLARSFPGWVIDELGPPPDVSFAGWAARLGELGVASAEALVGRRFEALRAEARHAAAAALVDDLAALVEVVDERLRFEAALAWRDAGEGARAEARLHDLAATGRTIYAHFAARALASPP